MTKEAPKRLGRGLAALLGDDAADEAGNRTQLMPVDRLDPGPFQARRSFDAEEMADLVASVRAQGILQPLLVRPDPGANGRYQIIAGERRWRAAQEAGLHDVPVMVKPLDNRQALAAGLIENLQRADLNPVEEADGYRRLQTEHAMTADQLASAIGRSRSHVANTMRLLGLPGPVLDMLRAGRLTAGHARALLAHPQPLAAAEEVVKRGLSVRQTEGLVAREPREPHPPQDPETAALATEISNKLGLRVDIRFDGKGGVVRIAYSTLDQLDGLVALLDRDRVGPQRSGS